VLRASLCAASAGGVACSRWSRVVAIALLDVRSDPDGVGVRVVREGRSGSGTELSGAELYSASPSTSASMAASRESASRSSFDGCVAAWISFSLPIATCV